MSQAKFDKNDIWRKSGGFIMCEHGGRCYKATFADLFHPKVAEQAAKWHTAAFGHRVSFFDGNKVKIK